MMQDSVHLFYLLSFSCVWKYGGMLSKIFLAVFPSPSWISALFISLLCPLRFLSVLSSLWGPVRKRESWQVYFKSSPRSRAPSSLSSPYCGCLVLTTGGDKAPLWAGSFENLLFQPVRCYPTLLLTQESVPGRLVTCPHPATCRLMGKACHLWFYYLYIFSQNH